MSRSVSSFMSERVEKVPGFVWHNCHTLIRAEGVGEVRSAMLWAGAENANILLVFLSKLAY